MDEPGGQPSAAAALHESRSAGGRPPRPPGGKALLRLLSELGSTGLVGYADEVLSTAVPGERRDAFAEAVGPLVLTPSATPGDGAAAPDQGPSDPGPDLPEVAAAYGEAAAELTPTVPGQPFWRSLGPWTIPNGQTYGSSRINVSGRVSCVAIDPGNPAHLLCGSAAGGVWESRDRGASWAPRTDQAATLTVGALCFARTAPATVLCGTGEGNWWSYLGQGVLRSTDGGTTWSTLCTAPFVGDGFYDLVIDPADASVVVAGTRGGLWSSSDGGATWTRRRTLPCWSVSVRPTGGAGAEWLAACSDGVQVSTDRGVTWSAVSISGAPASFHRLAVAISPSDPTVAYAWGSTGSSAYLFRRSGSSWSAQTTPPGVSVGQDWYDWFLAVAPDTSDQVYVGAIDSYRGDRSGGSWTWMPMSAKSSGDSIHPDQHAVAISPAEPATVYVGSDGGLYRSPDRGVHFQHLNNGLVITEIEYLTQDFGDVRFLLCGTQDNGSERYLGSPVWEHVNDGDGGDCGTYRDDARTVFCTRYDMTPFRSGSRGAWGSWTYVPPPIPSSENRLFYPPLELSATTGKTVAMGAGSIWVSRDLAASWTSVALPSGAECSALAVPGPDDVFAGCTDGRVFHTRWNGSAWGNATALGTPRTGAYVSDLEVDPADQSRMWLTHRTFGGGRVWSSTDGGTNWTDRTAGLPGLPVNAVTVDPANRNRVWVAADLGVYQSLDGGQTWSTFANGLPNCFIGDLVFHPHARLLRAGTRNRGAWEVDVDGPMTAPWVGVQWNGALAANETRRWFTFNWPAVWHVIWTVMPTSVRPGNPQVTWTTGVERASTERATYWIQVTNLTPDPLTFEGRFAVLSRH
jgi:photosystem II stability/assembly factor-like uncharacterized protein